MELSAILFLASGLFLGWSLGANDAANVFGTAVGSRMIRFAAAAAIASVFVVLGAVISGAGAAHTLGTLGSVNALAGAFMVAFAAAYTVYVMTKWGLPVSTTQAIVGAIVGWNIFSGSTTDATILSKILATWVACPILAALIAIPTYKLTELFVYRMKLHLLRQDAYIRLALILAGAFGAYSLGANNIANVVGVFLTVSPFTDFDVARLFTVTSAEQLFLLGGIAIAVGIITYSKRVMLTVGQDLLPLSPAAAWVAVLAHSIVLMLFASEGLEHLLASAGLPTIPLVPVSSSQAIVGAVIGVGLFRGGREIRWKVVAQIGAAWVSTPIISALLCLVTLFVLQNVFNQQVYRPVKYSLTPEATQQLASLGFSAAALERLEGRTFDSSVQFLRAVRRNTSVAEADERRLLHFGELGRFEFTQGRIDKVNEGWLGAEQVAAIRRLAGRQFDYKWQVARALATESEAWKMRPAEPVNKLHNKEIEEKLEFVYRTFGEEQKP